MGTVGSGALGVWRSQWSTRGWMGVAQALPPYGVGVGSLLQAVERQRG